MKEGGSKDIWSNMKKENNDKNKTKQEVARRERGEQMDLREEAGHTPVIDGQQQHHQGLQ